MPIAQQHIGREHSIFKFNLEIFFLYNGCVPIILCILTVKFLVEYQEVLIAYAVL